MIHKYKGQLVLKNDTTYEYGIYNKNQIKYTNISEILKKVYHSPTSMIGIVINIDNSWEDSFNEVGELYFDKDEFGVYCWFVNGVCLDKVLFDNVGKENVTILIDDKINKDKMEEES